MHSPHPDHQESPTYWFAILEIARSHGNFEDAANAKRQLERLGVRVEYGRPQKAEAVHA